jgi:hypothetical protein
MASSSQTSTTAQPLINREYAPKRPYVNFDGTSERRLQTLFLYVPFSAMYEGSNCLAPELFNAAHDVREIRRMSILFHAIVHGLFIGSFGILDCFPSSDAFRSSSVSGQGS